MHFSHSEHSVPTHTTLDRKMWRKRMGTSHSDHPPPPSPEPAKVNRNRLTVSPEGLLWIEVVSSHIQVADATVQQPKQELQWTPSNNRIHSFESKTELLKISKLQKVAACPLCNP